MTRTALEVKFLYGFRKTRESESQETTGTGDRKTPPRVTKGKGRVGEGTVDRRLREGTGQVKRRATGRGPLTRPLRVLTVTSVQSRRNRTTDDGRSLSNEGTKTQKGYE